MAGCPPEIEMASIICMNMITMKYVLAAFLIYSNRLKGKKVNHVYLAVFTTLLMVSSLNCESKS